MIKSYLLTAWRNMKRNRLHASINIIGLAIGMTCSILITLFVQFELSYDRQNKDAERIYRLVVDLEANDWAISAFPLGALLKDNFPEIESYTRIKPVNGIFLRNSSSGVKHKEKLFYADSTVFDILDVKLVKGNPTGALAEVNTMVLTEERARAYFGDEDPIGKTITRVADNREFMVTGIFEPLPSASHVHFDILVSSESFEPMRADFQGGWGYLTNHYTYIRTSAPIDHVDFGTKVSAFLDEFQQLTQDQRRNVIRLQPLTSIHLHSNRGLEIEPNGNISTVYILAAIAFFILIIACINFMNLTTAQSLKRAREIGVRKVAGGKRSQLVVQFLSESVLISFISLCLAILLLVLIVPLFNDISGKQIVLNPLVNGAVSVIFLAITLFVGLCAGLYPAFVLSDFKPALVLKGSFAGNVSGQRLRKAMVVFQFGIAFVIMVGTYVVYEQLNYMRNKDMGFDREQVLVVKLPNDSIGDAAVKEEMKRLANVRSVTRFVEVPGQMVHTSGVWYEGVKDDVPVNTYIFSGDPDLTETLGMKMIAGNYFTHETQQFGREYIINEAAARQFGWKVDEAIGKLMNIGNRGDDPGKVIGVIGDFHYKHLHESIGPLVMFLQPAYEGRYMGIKIASGDISATVSEIEEKWKSLVPQHQFEYTFLDESFNALFNQEERLGQIFSVFSGLAVFISCLGLFGLASFTMEQSRKAVAVRKVLGATVGNIVFMMSKDFLKLVVFGMILAAPVAYYAMNKWLAGFAYNVGFTWLVFFYTAGVAVAIAFLTVSYHSLRAATSSPVKSLKE